MRTQLLGWVAALGVSMFTGAVQSGDATREVDIRYTRFTLPNGLTVIVSEDHKAPIVAVGVWYHVGSAYEPAGKTGFAHLFEHLMFSGSEHHPSSYFEPFELVGATGMNGTTWVDRTNYFETVPTTALDLALWMESDRMGHLLGAIGQKELDVQRGVVQNEKRQGENQPYGRVFEDIQAHAFPANHPYHHDTIGSMADLNAASLATVKQWFRDYYGAANTTLVLAGDITPAAARQKVARYFGDIAAGQRVPRPQPWIAARDHATRNTMTDNVAQARVYREWNTPGLRVPGDDRLLLDLAAEVLGGGRTSRLYQRLVYQDQLADDVSMSNMSFELASMTVLQIDVKEGVDPAKVEAATADEWQKLLDEGPTADELQRAKTAYEAATIRGLEQIGGFSGKAVTLAEGQVYRGDPEAWKHDYDATMSATAAGVQAAAAKWLTKGDYTLTVVPGEVDEQEMATPVGRAATSGRPADLLSPAATYRATASEVDRSTGLPEVSTFPDLSFPPLQRGQLGNGIEVVLAERHAIPVVQVEALFDAGYAADQGRRLGTSSFTMGMLDEGTQDLDSVEIAKRKQRLGAEIATGCDLDTCSVWMSALNAHLEDSLSLYANIIRNPAFRAADMARVRGQWLAGIEQEKSQPTTLALRLLPPILYGPGNAYAIPFTGSGNKASIAALTTDDLRGFLHDYLRPDNVQILITGDTTLARIIPQLERVFGDWQAPSAPIPTKNLAAVAYPAHPSVYLVDRPGAQQSVLIAGLVAPSTTAPNNLEINTMDSAFGGTFTSRLNLNLREGKHWAYGAFSFSPAAVGQRPFLLYAPVQTDQTAPSIQEIIAEARAVTGDRPLADAEIQKIKDNEVRKMPGQYETAQAVLNAVTGIVKFGRPDDYVATLKARIEGQDHAAINAAARALIHPDKLTWVIVGDLAKIEGPVRALDLGEVRVVDADGAPVQ